MGEEEQVHGSRPEGKQSPQAQESERFVSPSGLEDVEVAGDASTLYGL